MTMAVCHVNSCFGIQQKQDFVCKMKWNNQISSFEPTMPLLPALWKVRWFAFGTRHVNKWVKWTEVTDVRKCDQCRSIHLAGRYEEGASSFYYFIWQFICMKNNRNFVDWVIFLDFPFSNLLVVGIILGTNVLPIYLFNCSAVY